MIAVLYVDPRGHYMKMPGVDPWDATRDATRYEGPHPIVAHPACGPWGSLKALYKGKEGGPELAIRGVEQVRKWGGVLEHPAYSGLWPHCGLPKPGEPRDTHGGITIQVDQVDWGHVARKRTWLYLVRVPDFTFPEWPAPRKPTHWIGGSRKSGSQNHRGDLLACSAEQRRRTPPAFADFLIALARGVRYWQ